LAVEVAVAVGLGRLVGGALLAAALLWRAAPASALAVNPFFSGHGTIDATSQIGDYRVYDAGLDSLFGQSQIDIDVAHGMVDNGGLISHVTPGDWSFDMSAWAPLMNNVDITRGGEVTYGFPSAGVFAVSWVNVANSDDPSLRNTFQVVFVGTSGFSTNSGIAVAPGSVIFAYGSPVDLRGTVNLSASSPAAIGILVPAGLTTLASLGIGDANGVLSPADVAALQNSGDPFLFNRGPYGLEPPVGFDSLVGSLPEPAAAALFGLVALCLGARARALRRA
jgi:hypothetical protein